MQQAAQLGSRNDGSSSVLAGWGSRGRWIQRLTNLYLGIANNLYAVGCFLSG